MTLPQNHFRPPWLFQPGVGSIANDLPSCELATMQNRVAHIDPAHTRAITSEVGERLRLMLGKQPTPSGSLQSLIDRLPELDQDSPPIAPE